MKYNMVLEKVRQIIDLPHVLYLLISLFTGFIFLNIVPPLWGMDEPSHFARAYQVAHGEIIPNTSKGGNGGKMPDSFNKVDAYRVQDILDGAPLDGTILHHKDVTNRGVYVGMLSNKFTKSETRFHGTAPYSPFAYPGPIVGIEVARTFHSTIGVSFFMSRFFSLIIYSSICFFALWLIRKSKIVWLFFMVALLPTAIFQASVVTADNILLAMALLFYSLYIRLFIGKDSKEIKKQLLVGLLAAGVLLPLIKINYIFISLSLVALPLMQYKSLQKKMLYGGAVVLVTTLPAFIWTLLVNTLQPSTVSQRADGMMPGAGQQISFIFQQPLHFIGVIIKTIIRDDGYFSGLFSTISGNNIKLPIIVTVAIFFALLIAAFYAKDELLKMKKVIIIISAVSLVGALSILATLYISFNPVGWWIIDGVQSRYFLPFLLPIVCLIALLIPIQMNISRKNITILSLIISGGSLVIALLYSFISYY
ncbi:MAG: hypothetical protein JWN75_801 [Candidatus Saccharibacteria bacterium]|nr:hypothetical protein [Candidatus Saccharibacteria bacterium]